MPKAAIKARKYSDISVKNGDHAISPYVYALLIGSLLINIGTMWDISWHISIGRDQFLTPPHDAIYLGAVMAGTICGFLIIKRSFFGTITEKAGSVKFWSIFYSPLGVLFCVWGSIVMLTGAPFDNWWHNTYGLDIKILSPPHVVVAIGIMSIQFGAFISVITAGAGKTFNASVLKKYNWLFAITTGLFLSSVFALFYAQFDAGMMHSSTFYIICSLLFPICLVAFSVAAKTRWGATATVGVYMSIVLIMEWLLPLFPAKPLLGPVYNPIDHFQQFRFPVLLIFPALAIDLTLYKLKNNTALVKILSASVAFLLIFLVVHWYFGTFYHTSVYSRNWFFYSNAMGFQGNPATKYRYIFNPNLNDTGIRLVKGIAISCICTIISGTLGYSLGGWMKKIQR